MPTEWQDPEHPLPTVFPKVRRVSPTLWQGLRASVDCWVLEILSNDFQHTLSLETAPTREKALEAADTQLGTPFVASLLDYDREVNGEEI